MTQPPRRDLLLAFVLAAVGAVEALSLEGVPARPVAVTMAVLGGLALAWRRAAPLLTATVVAVGPLAALPLLGAQMDRVLQPLVVILVAGHAAGSMPNRARARAGLAVLLIGGAVSLVATGKLGDLAFAAVVIGGAWLAGAGEYVRSAYARLQEERAAAVERERDLRMAEAVAEERLRIARDLHDVVTHALSVMTLQAGGLRRVLNDGSHREEEVLRGIERTGRQALAEMSRMLGVLRGDDQDRPLDPQPGLDALDELASRLTEAGVPTRMREVGQRFDVEPSVATAAYRIAQEALTNVLKHAGAGRAELVLRFEPEALCLEVTDDGQTTMAEVPGGRGLVGMRERAAAFGGWVQAGPRACGGFRVAARLPAKQVRR
jgi:signal transduction histidine kinase